MKSTKKSLLAGGLALLVCCTLLIGTTFAWFTDSVTNTGNQIQAGKLSVDLMMDKEEDGDYVSISDGEGDIFSIAEPSDNGIKWEPGKTEIVYLAFKNTGSLAASVDFNIHAKAPEGKKDLSGALDYVLLRDVKAGGVKAENWEELIEGQTVHSGKGRTLLLNDLLINEGKTRYYALAVHMQEEAGNEYMDAGVEINAFIEASQGRFERDAFNQNYDRNAKYFIETADELSFMLANPENGATYVIADDITWEGGKISALQSARYTIDLNGHVVTLNGNTGYALDKETGINVELTVVDNSAEKNGLLKSGGARLIVCDAGDVITGNGYLVGGSDRENNIVRGTGEWTN